MPKRTEEGDYWEWRAFGRIEERIRVYARSHPVRMGVLERPEHDIYLVSPANDQNLKLRKDGANWVLKVKVLLNKVGPGTELYREDPAQVFGFPLSPETVESAAALLAIRPPDEPCLANPVNVDDFKRIMTGATPPVRAVEVFKIRSQYAINDGWLELASVEFPRNTTDSIAIQAAEISVLQRSVAAFAPDQNLVEMNYVEACRIWE